MMFPSAKEIWICSNPNCDGHELVTDKRCCGGQAGIPVQEITGFCTSCDRIYFTSRKKFGDIWGPIEEVRVLAGAERLKYLKRLDEPLAVLRRPGQRRAS